MSHTWFRVYNGVLDDPKVQKLSPALFRHLINLWCLTSLNDGILPPIETIAFRLRLSQKKAEAIIRELAERKLLDRQEDGKWSPHNWSKRQFRSDSSTERVRKFRAKSSQGETFHGTAEKRSMKHPDSESVSVSESESVSESVAYQVVSNDSLHRGKAAEPKKLAA